MQTTRKMRGYFFTLLVLFFAARLLPAQDFDDLPGVDTVYFDDIRSIEFRVSAPQEGNSTEKIGDLNRRLAALEKKKKLGEGNLQELEDEIKSLTGELQTVYDSNEDRDSWKKFYRRPVSQFPILSRGRRVYFAFDDLNPEETSYSFTIRPYSWDWSRPLDLSESEYLDGYSYSSIDEYVYPELVSTHYTAYRFHVPNKDFRPVKGGNYLLIVYETNSEQVAFTRRLFVMEPDFQFEEDTRGLDFDRDSMQCVNFTVSYPEQYGNLLPDRDVKVVVYQNSRPDNAITVERPVLAIGRKLRYGYQEKICFPAGKQFRTLRMQTFDYKQNRVQAIKKSEEEIEVFLTPDRLRKYEPGFYYPDFNGMFVTMNGIRNEEPGDPDYAYVYFTLPVDEPLDQDLYIIGKFTDWQLKDEYRLSYNPRKKRYEGEVLLKQGFYDYYYALRGAGGRPDTGLTEGNSYRTTNDYTVLVYYTPPGARFQKLVAAKTFELRP